MLNNEQIEKLALKHEAFGFGAVDERGHVDDGVGAARRDPLCVHDADRDGVLH